MKIRDDDISYFTTPKELEKVWAKWYGKVDILFAITPFIVETKEYQMDNREFNYHQLGEEEFDIGNNIELVEYIKKLLDKGYIKIGLHGYNHKYIISDNNLIAEYDIKDEKLLYKKSIKAKKYLEELFKITIETFIPPDNAVSKEAMKALSRANFKKVCRAFPLKNIDTKISLNYFIFWIKRVIFKIRYDLVYSKLYFNGYIMEEASYLYKGQDIDKLIEDYEVYKKYSLPFTLATHYWELEDNMKENLDIFLEYSLNEK